MSSNVIPHTHTHINPNTEIENKHKTIHQHFEYYSKWKANANEKKKNNGNGIVELNWWIILLFVNVVVADNPNGIEKYQICVLYYTNPKKCKQFSEIEAIKLCIDVVDMHCMCLCILIQNDKNSKNTHAAQSVQFKSILCQCIHFNFQSVFVFFHTPNSTFTTISIGVAQATMRIHIQLLDVTFEPMR